MLLRLYRSTLVQLAMSLCGAFASAVVDFVRQVMPQPEMLKLEAELEQAKQPAKLTDHRKPAAAPLGTALARDFVTMLRTIGGQQYAAN